MKIEAILSLLTDKNVFKLARKGQSIWVKQIGIV